MLVCSVGVIRTANGMEKPAKFTERSAARAVALFPYVVARVVRRRVSGKKNTRKNTRGPCALRGLVMRTIKLALWSTV